MHKNDCSLGSLDAAIRPSAGERTLPEADPPVKGIGWETQWIVLSTFHLPSEKTKSYLVVLQVPTYILRLAVMLCHLYCFKTNETGRVNAPSYRMLPLKWRKPCYRSRMYACACARSCVCDVLVSLCSILDILVRSFMLKFERAQTAVKYLPSWKIFSLCVD